MVLLLAWMLGAQVANADCVCDSYEEQWVSDRAKYDYDRLPEIEPTPEPEPTPKPTEDNGQ